MNSINKNKTHEHVLREEHTERKEREEHTERKEREEREEPFKIDDQTLLDAVLGPTHSITAEYVTLRFSQKQPGHNALAQLINRIKDYELTTNQRMSQLISEIEALEKLVLSQTQDKEAPSAAPVKRPVL